MLVKLKKGDEIQILAPSSFIDKEEDFIKGIDILKTWGLKIVHNNILSRKFGYFAGLLRFFGLLVLILYTLWLIKNMIFKLE